MPEAPSTEAPSIGTEAALSEVPEAPHGEPASSPTSVANGPGPEVLPGEVAMQAEATAATANTPHGPCKPADQAGVRLLSGTTLAKKPDGQRLRIGL